MTSSGPLNNHHHGLSKFVTAKNKYESVVHCLKELFFLKYNDISKTLTIVL